MMEEQVIQETSTASPEQPLADSGIANSNVGNTVDIDVSAYEQRIQSEKSRAEKAEQSLKSIKQQLDELHTKQTQEKREKLQEQGQWQPLWEEANKSGIEKDKKIAELERELQDVRASNETAAMQNAALSAISQAGAINSEQMLQLIQSNLRRSEDGEVKVLEGGIEQDINVYLAKLKNPGSSYEHHFKPSAQAGMGAKPNTSTANAAGIANPWLEGSMNLTKQMALKNSDPDLAALLEREAQR